MFHEKKINYIFVPGNKTGYQNGCVEVPGDMIFEVSGINEINTTGLNINAIPNPWSDYSSLLVTANKREAAVLDLYDISGKLIHHRSLQLLEGENRLPLTTADCPATGMIMYRLTTTSGSSTGKMIRMK